MTCSQLTTFTPINLKDFYATEIYAFVSREPEFVALFVKFYELQAEFSMKIAAVINSSIPSLNSFLGKFKHFH